MTPSPAKLGRSSFDLGYKAAQSLYYAISEQADRIELPINIWATIDFSSTDADPRFATDLFGKVRSSFYVKWARRAPLGQTSYPPTYAYVFENSWKGFEFSEVHPDQRHHVHVHWFLHVPAERQSDFELEVFRWLDAVTSVATPQHAIKVTPITDAKGARTYALKGARHAGRFGARPEPQGLILGRRSGTSRNLGPTARLALDRKMRIQRRVA